MCFLYFDSSHILKVVAMFIEKVIINYYKWYEMKNDNSFLQLFIKEIPV